MIFDEFGKAISELPEDFEGYQLFEDDYGHFHIIPVQKKHLHHASTACWCGPFLDRRIVLTRSEVWLHHQVH